MRESAALSRLFEQARKSLLKHELSPKDPSEKEKEAAYENEDSNNRPREQQELFLEEFYLRQGSILQKLGGYLRRFVLRRDFLPPRREDFFGFCAVEASSRRFLEAQLGLLTWRPRPIPKASSGTLSVIVEPAAM